MFQRFNCVADVGFLIDGSESITEPRAGGVEHNWNLIKDLILVLAKDLNITEDGAHVAVGVFSSVATLDIKFSDFTDYASFEKEVIKLNHPRLRTDHLRAFDLAFHQMFNVSTGMRSGVPKTLILLTDGQCLRDCNYNAFEAGDLSCAEFCSSNYCLNTYENCDINEFARWGSLFRDQNIATIGIGIGNSIYEKEITDFVGQSNYYYKKSFNQILTKRFRRSLLLCEGKLVTLIFLRKELLLYLQCP